MSALQTDCQTVLQRCLIVCSLSVGLVGGNQVIGQEAAFDGAALSRKVEELRSKIADLERLLNASDPVATSAQFDRKKSSGLMPSGSMRKMRGMKSTLGKESPGGSQGMSKGMMGARKMEGASKASKGRGKQGMRMMGGRSTMMDRMSDKKAGRLAMMGKIVGMEQPVSALPGFAGASHIYHIGATGFYLDHGQHIELTRKQEASLSRIREQSMLVQATFDRRLSESDQQLWDLTGADQPDATKIEAKVREIEKLRGDKQIAFIRSVGEAAAILTNEQRQILIGFPLSGEAVPTYPASQGTDSRGQADPEPSLE